MGLTHRSSREKKTEKGRIDKREEALLIDLEAIIS